MQAIEVGAIQTPTGAWQPLTVTWQGQACTPEAVGRRWHEADGEHVLVMLPPDHHSLELLVSNEDRWFLVRDLSGCSKALFSTP